VKVPLVGVPSLELLCVSELLLCSVLEELFGSPHELELSVSELLLCSMLDELGVSATELELGCCGSSLPPFEEQEQRKARDMEIKRFLRIVQIYIFLSILV
jgi:hypothetical protein